MQSELLATAYKLLMANDGLPPSRTDIRRAISTAYYALFHHVADVCAQSLVGDSVKPLSRAKMQTYRSLRHDDILSACQRANTMDFGFPAEIRKFAIHFQNMHKARSLADYDPGPLSDFSLRHAQEKLGECADVIQLLNQADPDDRLAFAVLVAVKAGYSRKK